MYRLPTWLNLYAISKLQYRTNSTYTICQYGTVQPWLQLKDRGHIKQLIPVHLSFPSQYQQSRIHLLVQISHLDIGRRP